MNDAGNPWRVLGIEPTADEKEIRRAYSRRLKVTNPEDDPEGFKALRAAYERALSMREWYQDEQADAVAGSATRSPAPDFSQPAPPPPPDADRAALDALLEALARELSGELDVSRATQLQAQLLESGLLERFDLLQRAEMQLSQLLAAALPRSDPLLAAAEARFEWAKHQNDGNLPVPALQIVARLRDLWTRQQFLVRDSAEARAYRRLSAEPTAWQRCLRRVRAHFVDLGGHPEVMLLQHLDAEHPSLVADLRPENVEWWRRFASTPHFSFVGLVGTFFVAWIAAAIAFADTHPTWPPLIAIGCAVGVTVLRLYVVEWPIVLAQRRWYGRPPMLYSIGWLPASLAWMLAGIAVAPWPALAWSVAALAGLTALWATIAAGELPPVIGPKGVNLTNSRLIRIGLLNVFVAVWLGTTAKDLPGAFGMPLVLTMVAAMVASAMGRNLQIYTFSGYLETGQQIRACAAAIALSVALLAALFAFGRNPAAQLYLFAVVLWLVMARRALPFNLGMPDMAAGIMVFGSLLVTMFLRSITDEFDLTGEDANGRDNGSLVVGGIMMLLGVGISAGNWIYNLRQRQQ